MGHANLGSGTHCWVMQRFLFISYQRDDMIFLTRWQQIQRQWRQKQPSLLSLGLVVTHHFCPTLLFKASHKHNWIQWYRKKAHLLITEGNVTLQSGMNTRRKNFEATFAIHQSPPSDHKLFRFFPSTQYAHSHPRTTTETDLKSQISCFVAGHALVTIRACIPRVSYKLWLVHSCQCFRGAGGWLFSDFQFPLME